MRDMRDPFAGKWVLNTTQSQFDKNHSPSAGVMTFAAIFMFMAG